MLTDPVARSSRSGQAGRQRGCLAHGSRPSHTPALTMQGAGLRCALRRARPVSPSRPSCPSVGVNGPMEAPFEKEKRT